MTKELELQINLLKAELQKLGFKNIDDAMKYIENVDIQKLKEELVLMESVMKDLPPVTSIITEMKMIEKELQELGVTNIEEFVQQTKDVDITNIIYEIKNLQDQIKELKIV